MYGEEILFATLSGICSGQGTGARHKIEERKIFQQITILCCRLRWRGIGRVIGGPFSRIGSWALFRVPELLLLFFIVLSVFRKFCLLYFEPFSFVQVPFTIFFPGCIGFHFVHFFFNLQQQDNLLVWDLVSGRSSLGSRV